MTIRFAKSSDLPWRLRIAAVNGAIIADIETFEPAGNTALRISMPDYAHSGMYVYRLYDELGAEVGAGTFIYVR